MDLHNQEHDCELGDAYIIQKRAAERGFDWPDIGGVIEKIYEELEEVKAALEEKDLIHACSELGDVLFSVVNLARYLDANPSTVLRDTNIRFMERFTKMEQVLLAQGKPLDSCTLEEMDAVWNDVKRGG